MQSKTKKIISENILLDKFLAGIRQAYSNMDVARTAWPANASQIEAYFSDIIAKTIFNKFKESPQKCKKALSTLSVFTLYASLYHTEIVGLKVARILRGYKIKRKEILDFLFFIFSVIKDKIQNDIFCLKGTHKILSEKEIEKIDKSRKWKKAKDSKIKKEIANLIVALDNLVWAFYFDCFSCAGKEIQGPYLASENSVILVRDYFDLNPKEIWQTKNRYSSVKMYLKYPLNVGIKLDCANHIRTSEPLSDKLISFWIEINGKKIASLSEIRSFFRYFSRLAERQAKRVNNLPPLEILKKGAEIYYYRYKNFFNYYKEDWHPPQEIYERINSLGLKWYNYYKADAKKKKSPNFYVKLFNPQNNFIG